MSRAGVGGRVGGNQPGRLVEVRQGCVGFAAVAMRFATGDEGKGEVRTQTDRGAKIVNRAVRISREPLEVAPIKPGSSHARCKVGRPIHLGHGPRSFTSVSQEFGPARTDFRGCFHALLNVEAANEDSRWPHHSGVLSRPSG